MPKLIDPFIVYTPGCWDLLHVGHINFLEAAKGLGNILIVGVASDEVIKEDKGKPPVICLEHRLKMIQVLNCVNVGVPYYTLNFLPHLTSFNPDILVVGEDWGKDIRHKDAEDWVKLLNRRLVKLPYTDGISSTLIKHWLRKIDNKER